MRALITGFALLLLTGCTTYWRFPPGGDLAQFQRDDFACAQAAQSIAPPPNTYAPNITQGGWIGTAQAGTALQNEGNAWAHQANQDAMYDRCMYARGYAKQ